MSRQHPNCWGHTQNKKQVEKLRILSLFPWAGVSIFPALGYREFLVPRPSDFGIYTSIPPSQTRDHATSSPGFLIFRQQIAGLLGLHNHMSHFLSFCNCIYNMSYRFSFSGEPWPDFLTCVHAQLLSRVWLLVTLWTVACQALLSMGFPRQEYWSVLPFPPPGDLPDPGMEPTSPALAVWFFTTEPPGQRGLYFLFLPHPKGSIFFFLSFFFVCVCVTISKVFIEFGTMLFLLFMFWFFGHEACEILDPGIAHTLHWEKKA